jgi:hypothetical protein
MKDDRSGVENGCATEPITLPPFWTMTAVASRSKEWPNA